MNTWQVLKQMRYLIRKRTWEGTGAVVFNPDSVRCSAKIEESVLRTLMMPVIMMSPLDENSDPVADEEPDLISTNMGMHIIVAIQQDPTGQAALIGGSRVDGQSSSKGRGLLEIEEEVFAAVKSLNDHNGVRIQSRHKGAATPVLSDVVGYVLTRDYIWVAETTATRYYHTPTNFVCHPERSGTLQFTATWRNPPDRYDLRRVRLIYKAGSTPPTSVTDGTEFVLPTALPTTATITVVGAGTYSASLFACYDETNPTPIADQRFSEPATSAGIVVPP